MADEEVLVIGCMPIKQQPVAPIRGASRVVCGTCRTDCWFAPSSAIAAAGRAYRILCVPCAKAEIRQARERGEPVIKEAVTPAQLEEIRRNLPERN